MVSKGLPLVKQQNYIGTLLKQGFLHSGARCVMALTTQTRQGELRQGQGQGIGRSLGWFGRESLVGLGERKNKFPAKNPIWMVT